MNRTETYTAEPQWVTGAPPEEVEIPKIPVPKAPHATIKEKLRVYTPIHLRKMASDPQFYFFLTSVALTAAFSIALLIVGPSLVSAVVAAGTLLVAAHLLKLTLFTLIGVGIFGSLSIISRPTISREETFHWSVKKGQTENVRAMMDVGHLPAERDIGQAWFYSHKDILQLFQERSVPFGAYQEEISSCPNDDISSIWYFSNERVMETLKNYPISDEISFTTSYGEI
ncbi:MAG: hypothetical protein SNF33_02890 [Candidatus Algichlamydia australiensis]|nr:hypothetical protein [Chlamydiales bacterium]